MRKSIDLKPLKKTTLVEAVIERIVDLIRNGDLQPGDRLPSQRKLSDILGVGLSSVREALQGLAAVGLVDIRPGEGTFIQSLEPDFDLDLDIGRLSDALQRDMREQLNEARAILEGEIVALAARRVTDQKAKEILQALAVYESHSGEELKTDWGAHEEIHLSISRSTGNRFLVHMVRVLLEMVPSSLRDAGLLSGNPEDAALRVDRELDIHRHLCQAIVKGDEKAAREWMARHVQSEQSIIEEYYNH